MSKYVNYGDSRNSSFQYCVPKGTIAILLATYNVGNKEFLLEQLKSIEKQTYTDFICFIHDDGSTDGTEKIAKVFCDEYAEHFVYMGNNGTGGAKNNFMYMLSCIEADYYMFSDQDDVWFPDKIERTYDLMLTEERKNKKTPICVYSDLTVVDQNLNVLNHSFFTYSSNPNKNSLHYLLHYNVAAGCTIMINKSLRKEAIRVDIINDMFMHDWYLVALSKCIGNLIYLDKPLMYYRQHSDNTLGVKKKLSTLEKIKKYLTKPSEYLNMKRNHLNECKGNAKALLATLDINNTNRATIEYFLKIQNQSILFRIILYYKWTRE